MTALMLTAAATVGNVVVRTSLSGALFAVLVWLVCRALPRLPSAVRCLLWWGVCLRFLFGLTGWLPLGVPILPAPNPVAPTAPAAVQHSERTLVMKSGANRTVTLHLASPEIAGGARAGTARAVVDEPTVVQAALAILGLLWLTGACFQLGKLGREFWAIRRTLSGATVVADPVTLSLVASQAATIGLRRPPAVLVSHSATSPQTIGLRQPVVLLPDDPQAFSQAELAMAVAHELAHVRRRDLLWGWIPVLASRIFFFHPGAALAAREYSLAREAACDAETLRHLDLSPRAYGTFLLKLTTAAAPGGLAALSAAPAAKTLKRRIAMLQDATRGKNGRSRFIPVLAVAALLPVDFVSRPAGPALQVGFPSSVSEQAAGEGLGTVAAGIEPLRPASAAATERFRAKKPLSAGVLRALGKKVGATEDEPIAYFHYGNATITGVGGIDVEDLHTIGAFNKREGGGDMLWFRHHGKAYYTRDAATLSEVAEIYGPVEELGNAQGELGSQQGALGAKQGSLGERQGKLGAEQARLALDEADLSTREAEATVSGDADGRAAQLQAERAKVQSRREALRKRQSELSEQQRELGRQQEELGQQQQELGHQQEKLGRQQEKASAEAQTKMHALIDKLVSSGTAVPMP